MHRVANPEAAGSRRDETTSARRSACNISNAVRICPKWIGSKVPPKIPIGIMRPGVLPRCAPPAPRARAMDRRRGRPSPSDRPDPPRRSSASIVGRDRRGSARQRRLAARPHPLRAEGLVDGTCAREPQRDAREGPQVGEQRPEQQRRLLSLGAQTRQDAKRPRGFARERGGRELEHVVARTVRASEATVASSSDPPGQASAIRSISCCAASRLPSTRSASNRDAGASSVTPRSASRAEIQRGSRRGSPAA